MGQMKQKDLTMEILIKVADDLNKLFEQTIEIGEGDTDMDLLQKDLIEAGTELQKEDEISDESKEVLALLGVKLPWPCEEETPLDTDMPPNLIEKPKGKSAKPKDAKTTAKAEVKKNPKKEVKKAEPKAAKPAKPKVAKVEKPAGKEKTGKYTRIQAFCDALTDTPKTISEISEKSKKLYINANPKIEPKGVERYTKILILPLIIFGIVIVQGDKYSLKVK